MRKKSLLIALAILGVSLNSFNFAQAKMTRESRELYRQAIKFENEKRYNDALDLLEKALATSPDDITLNTKLAGLYSDAGEFDKALDVYQKLLRLNSNDGFLYISIGNILQQKNEYDKAYEAYSEAQILMPDYTYNYLNIADVEYLNSNYEDAIKNYELFLSLLMI